MSSERAALALGATTYGYMYRRNLDDSLRAVAAAGYNIVELLAAPPHLDPMRFGWYERRSLKELLSNLGLSCAAVNPAELNLLSANGALRELAVEQYSECVRFAHDLEIPYVVVIPGRLSSLIPPPPSWSHALLREQIAKLVDLARPLGVTVTIETSPFGFLGTGGEVAEVVEEFNDSALGVCFDGANVFANQDIAEGVQECARWLRIAHLSDTWKNRFAHTSVGRGEVDFEAYAGALTAAGFTGPSIYELVDGEDPDSRLRADRHELARCGWAAQAD